MSDPQRQDRETDQDLEVVHWEDVEVLCTELAEKLRAVPFDAILAIARGGLVPAAILAQELDKRDVLVAAVASYKGDHRGEKLHFLEFPPDQAIVDRRILIVDDIWDSGRTLALTRRRVVDAGGTPIAVVLHYKPEQSLYPEERPDIWVRETNAWIRYPWERDL